MNQTVKELRKSLKMTQEVFAEQVGVSQSRIASAERGDVSEELVDKIYQKFKIKVTISDKVAVYPDWVNDLIAKIEAAWKEENNFLRSQLEKKDMMIEALTNKFLKFEDINWPPKTPGNGIDGVDVQELQQAA